MYISVTDAKGQLTDLVRRAEAGEEIIFTRHGHAVARLCPVKQALDVQARRQVLDALLLSARDKVIPGEDAARSQDFLYDGDGLPF